MKTLTEDHNRKVAQFTQEFPVNSELIIQATAHAAQKKLEVAHETDGTKDVSEMIFPLSHFLDSEPGKLIFRFLGETGKSITIAKEGNNFFVLNKVGFHKLLPDRRIKRRVANREILERFCNPRESVTGKEQEPENLIPFLIKQTERLAESIYR